MMTIVDVIKKHPGVYQLEKPDLSNVFKLTPYELIEQICVWLDYCEEQFELVDSICQDFRRGPLNPDTISFISLHKKLIQCKENILQAEYLVRNLNNKPHMYRDFTVGKTQGEITHTLTYMYETRYVYVLEEILKSLGNYMYYYNNHTRRGETVRETLNRLNVELAK